MKSHRNSSKNIRAPRLTAGGYAALLLYGALPFLVALAAADGLLYLFFRYVLGSCYGIGCL